MEKEAEVQASPPATAAAASSTTTTTYVWTPRKRPAEGTIVASNNADDHQLIEAVFHTIECKNIPPPPVPTPESESPTAPIVYEGTHRLAYVEWRVRRGENDNDDDLAKRPILIAVHGLTRNSRDFDDVAISLVRRGGYRVVCPDMPGRWYSDPLPATECYNLFQYAHDVRTLVKHLGVNKVDYLGTSMGGIIGMILASTPHDDSQDPPTFEVGKVVLNDIGAFVGRTALIRLSSYVGKMVRFKSLSEAVTYVMDVAKSFGCETLEEWTKFALNYVRPMEQEDGEYKFELHYDMRLSAGPQDPAQVKDIDLFPFWDKMQCASIGVVRGADSDILTKATLEEMVKRSRVPVRYFEFEGVGHAPTLMPKKQIEAVCELFGV